MSNNKNHLVGQLTKEHLAGKTSKRRSATSLVGSGGRREASGFGNSEGWCAPNLSSDTWNTIKDLGSV